ncbi:hypothetical protein [Thalassotalea sp. PS06]|uniref:hypothetical protein n=1 Tax=Thalassotalea sp. PS06 TaxID=2594005 RepID=UPI0011626314|nr:hypothetical protein [Thalassotalea sp. PS06]QDP00669.1 hypothetical protein FNC98_04450 [Thalassotalea sp. PS06]
MKETKKKVVAVVEQESGKVYPNLERAGDALVLESSLRRAKQCYESQQADKRLTYDEEALSSLYKEFVLKRKLHKERTMTSEYSKSANSVEEVAET